METPKNKAGKLTEELMSEIHGYLRAETSNYNRVYEAVYRVLVKATGESK